MNKSEINPTVVNLKEIPEEGRIYNYSKASGELSLTLKDIVGNNSYTAEIQIKPMGNLFELKGFIRSDLDLICSRCAIDLVHPVDINFNELLLIDDPTDYSNGSQSRANYNSESAESDRFCQMIESYQFNLADFFHEVLAINEPMRPLGSPDCDLKCENYDKAVEKGWIQVIDDMDRQAPESPFSALKDLKLNS